MLINGTLTKLYPALFIPNSRWETDKLSLACILILNSQALHLAFRLCVYLLQRVITMFEFLLQGGDLLGEKDKCSSLVALELTTSPSC